MRNPINVLKSLEEKACNADYKYERLYRNLYNQEFYLLAYNNIAKSQGSMTSGTDKMTLDDMSLARIDKIIAKLKDHSYQPNPARREYIEKKNSTKKRPLGIPSTNDKLIQEVVRMILEAIYEPTFSKNSHGFRPNRSCHTALNEISTTFNGAKWVIEGDIKACFDSFDHHVLVGILRRKIEDEYFISLIWKLLKAGYMEQFEYKATYSGTPQGSGVSPILANIYLTELDEYMSEFKQKFDTISNGNRKPSKKYMSINTKYSYRISKLKKLRLNEPLADYSELISEIKKLRNIRRETPYYPIIDPSYKRIQYNRYADDFVIGVIGSKEDAENIKNEIKGFLNEKLNLILSEEKTKVTHSSDLVRYLGYDFTVSRSRDVKKNANGDLQKYWYGRVKLYVPHEKWVNKLREYQALKVYTDERGNEKWTGTHRGKLMNKPEIEIVNKFNSEIRGIYNYYRMADNVSVLNKFYYVMKGSLYRTFAAKYNTTFNKIKDKYEKDKLFGVSYETKAGKKHCEFYHDGFTKNNTPVIEDLDILPQHKKYDKPNSLAKRLKANICEVCGISTSELHMHHVKRLKDLTGKTEFEIAMILKRRKSLALCIDCYEKTRI